MEYLTILNFDQLQEDFDHFEPILEMAVNRIPMLGEAGIHTFFNGPEVLLQMTRTT